MLHQPSRISACSINHLSLQYALVSSHFIMFFQLSFPPLQHPLCTFPIFWSFLVHFRIIYEVSPSGYSILQRLITIPLLFVFLPSDVACFAGSSSSFFVLNSPGVMLLLPSPLSPHTTGVTWLLPYLRSSVSPKHVQKT